MGGGRAHDAFTTRRTEHGKGQAEDCYMTPQMGILGPKATIGGGSPTAGMGCPLGRTWPAARAVPTQSSETGKLRELRWHNLPTERKSEEGGKDSLGRERVPTLIVLPVAHRWADWLNNLCRLGGPQRFEARNKIRSGPQLGKMDHYPCRLGCLQNHQWPTSGRIGYLLCCAATVSKGTFRDTTSASMGLPTRCPQQRPAMFDGLTSRWSLGNV